jgi:predicted secreted protein with PEFG-CTERM motif
MLIISPIFIQISFASNSTIDESGSYKIHCTHFGGSYDNGTDILIDEYPVITYHIINGSITNFDTQKNMGLTISITNSSNAVLTLNLPVTFINTNVPFGPLGFNAQTEDGRIVSIHVQKNSTDNILLVNLPSGNYNLLITVGGTPEAEGESMKDCILVTKIPKFGSLTGTMSGEYSLNCQGNYYDISYQVSNATVSNFTAHSNFQMIFDIQNSKNGIITVDVPRNFLKESIPQNPIGYAVSIDDHLLNYKVMGNSTHRILTINLPDGHFGLRFDAGGYPETMGSSFMSCSVVPEFGSLAGMIIVISIIGVVLISRKFNYRVL